MIWSSLFYAVLVFLPVVILFMNFVLEVFRSNLVSGDSYIRFNSVRGFPVFLKVLSS